MLEVTKTNIRMQQQHFFNYTLRQQKAMISSTNKSFYTDEIDGLIKKNPRKTTCKISCKLALNELELQFIHGIPRLT